MGNNKIVFGNTTLMDLTSDTVTPSKLAAGETAHDRSGEQITGTAVDLDGLSTSTTAITDNDIFATKENGGSNWVKKAMSKVAEYVKTKIGNQSAASGGTTLSLVTTGEKYAWNSKQDALTNPLTQSDVKNNLTSTDTAKPLSAYQGKVLDSRKLGEFVSATDVTISSVTYHTYWEVAPTSSNQVYGVAIHPTNGRLCRIYNNKGTYAMQYYDKDDNTNNAVTQTADNSNSNYEVLFSATADNTTRTEGAKKYSNLTFNPSTGNLKATQLNGVTIGNSPKFTDTTYENKSAASGGTAVSLCTTGEKYTWNNKTDDTKANIALAIERSTSAFPTGDAYSTSSAYNVGNLVIYNNKLYRCKTACSAASWNVNSTNFEETTLTKVATQLNSDLIYKQKTLNVSNGTGYMYFSRIAQIGFLEVRFTATNNLTSTSLEIGTLPDSLKPLHFMPLPIGIGDDHYGIDDIGTITISNDTGIIKITYYGSKSGMKSAMGAVLFYINE